MKWNKILKSPHGSFLFPRILLGFETAYPSITTDYGWPFLMISITSTEYLNVFFLVVAP